MNNKPIYYTGIGSRKTPDDILETMTQTAALLEKHNMILRSGGAEGADQAFQKGVSDPKNMEIYIPWNGFNGLRTNQEGIILPDMSNSLFKIAAHFHPNWDMLSPGGRKLHARNVHQIVGPDIHASMRDLNFSRFVLCWTPGGKGLGGTGQAIRLAQYLRIPVFDLYGSSVLENLSAFLEEEILK